MPPLPYKQTDSSATGIDDPDESQPNLLCRLCSSTIFLQALLFIIFAVGLPILVFVMFFSHELTLFDENHNVVDTKSTCSQASKFRKHCGFQNISSSICGVRGCCFTAEAGCFHSVPSLHQFASNDNFDEHSANIQVEMRPSRKISPLGVTSISVIEVSIVKRSDHHLQIGFLDPAIAKTDQNEHEMVNSTSQYWYRVFRPTFFVEVYRSNNNSSMLSTARGPFTVNTNHFEWIVHLGSELMFGFGEFILKPGFKKLLISTPKHGILPVITVFNSTSQNYHAVAFSCPGPLEIEIAEDYSVILKGMFSNDFKMDLFIGPTLPEITKQLIDHFKLKSDFTYWVRGVHFCNPPFNKITTESLDEIQDLLRAKIPFDSHCVFDDLMWLSELQPTWEPKTHAAILALQNAKKKIILSVNTPVVAPITKAVCKNILFKDRQQNTSYDGSINEMKVSYIDWSRTFEDIEKCLKEVWHTQVPVDGYLLKNNWISDESKNETEIPDAFTFPYLPNNLSEIIANITPWYLELGQKNSKQFFLSSLNTLASEYLTKTERYLGPNAIVFSEIVSTHNIDGAFYTQVNASWSGLRKSVQNAINDPLSMGHLAASPVCGDLFGAVATDLCIRWYQFASLTPSFRVAHDRAPHKFPKYAEQLMIKSIQRRYSLLAYFHTLLVSDQPWIRSMAYGFPALTNQSDLYAEQFLIGPALLGAPVLLPHTSIKRIFMPDTYFEIGGGQSYLNWTNFAVVDSDLPLFIRNGHIVPLHSVDDSLNAGEVQLTPFYLLVALNCSSHSPIECAAEGFINVTQGFSWEFKADHEKITIYVPTDNQTFLTLTCGEKRQFTSQIKSITVFGHKAVTTENTHKDDINFDLCKENILPATFTFKFTIY